MLISLAIRLFFVLPTQWEVPAAGLVYNKEELKTVCARGLQASLVGQVLVEESILGWEELELEVVRDEEGNMITVCFIENIDPLGVHTGDSFCAAPMLTISKELQARLQEQAYRIVDSVRVIGGTNVQFAHDPVSDRIVVIEINPRTSRSSALASKATGFPIALVSAMLAAGLTLKVLNAESMAHLINMFQTVTTLLSSLLAGHLRNLRVFRISLAHRCALLVKL